MMMNPASLAAQLAHLGFDLAPALALVVVLVVIVVAIVLAKRGR